jgi:hypothetical protein
MDWSSKLTSPFHGARVRAPCLAALTNSWANLTVEPNTKPCKTLHPAQDSFTSSMEFETYVAQQLSSMMKFGHTGRAW